MSILKDYVESPQPKLAGTDNVFIDADTLVQGDNKYRIQGINAPEVEKLLASGKYKMGTAGGAASTDIISGLANKQGFTNIVPILDEDGEPQVDQFGRQLIDLKNENGESFKTKILESGVLGVNRYTNADDQLAAELGESRRIQDRLAGRKSDDLWEQSRVKLEEAMLSEGYKNRGFKQTAIDEAHLAAARAAGVGHYFSQDTVQIRDYDKHIDNKSANPFSDSWEQGWVGVKEGAYGMLNLLGETTGSETLADIGEGGVSRARDDLKDYGTTLTDWKDIEDVGTAFSYLTNNMALSLPYMAVSIGGAALAPVTFGASLAAPASVYAGQTWNEMEGANKNAGVAIASGVVQAALDRLGIGAIFSRSVGPTKLLNKAVDTLVTKQGYTKEAAKQAVLGATKKELAGFVGDVGKIASQQIAGKEIFKNLVKRGVAGGSVEAVTEGLQEATGYLAAHHTGEGFDFNELNDRVLAGVIAGGALGKAFSVPGALADAGGWADLAFRVAPADAAKLSRAGKYAEQEVTKHGRVKSVQELNEETRSKTASQKPNEIPTMSERIDSHEQSKKGRSIKDQVFDALVSAPALWRGATRNIFTEGLLEKSRAARIMADMFGGSLQRTFSGSNYENSKFHKVSTYKNMLPLPQKTFVELNNGKHANRKARGEISDRLYDKMRKAIDPRTKKFDARLIPDSDPEKAVIVNLQQQMQNLGNTMYNNQKKYNKDLGYLNNYLIRYKSFDKRAINNNKADFIAALRQEFPTMSEADAKKVADNITDSTEINDLSDAMDETFATQAGARPGAHKRRSLNLSERDAFKPFFERDIFANMSSAVKSAARFEAQQEFLGKNNSHLSTLLQQMEDEGVSKAEVDKVAKQLNDYLLAESGNFKRPTTEAGKKLQKIQRNFMMFVTMAGLPLATVSSFVEAALTFRGLTKEQIFGKGNALEHFGRELGSTLWKGMEETAKAPTNRPVMPAATKGKDLLQELGYYEWDVGAATVTGVTETNPWQQQIYEAYFKATGLTGWTNFTRAVRAAIAGDYITNKLQVILDGQGETKTNEVQEAEEGLRNIGVNVQDMLEAYRGNGMFDPAKVDVINANMKEGMFNFINDAVALPQSGNRPLIYQDPRFALFTQFQGFIATFTANHIPKLWGEYVKRGSPAMKYNAFAVMTTMIMLGFASQYLKDLLKHGEYIEFGPDEHPFLNTSEYVQRGIRASGLLGTGERVLDQFFPLYEQQSDGVGSWLWNTTSGESPALGYFKRALKGGGKLIEGDVGGAAKEATRFVPGAGVLNWLRDRVETTADQWNFKG